MPKMRYLAEVDARGNVLGLLGTERPVADVLAENDDDERRLVPWDGHVEDDEAYRRRWDFKAKRWTDSTGAHRAEERDRRAEDERLAEQQAGAGD